jgi:hypothetical protein
MRRILGACATVLICAVATGCPGWPGGRLIPIDSTSEKSLKARSFSPTGFDKVFDPAQAEGLFVESVLIERPVGDPFLDRELWSRARTALPPQMDALLAENGLRVVVLGGNLPAEFQQLIESETDTVNPYSLTFANRREAVLPTAGPHKKCEYEILADLAGEKRTIALEEARGGILVRPSLNGNRVKVWCEPRVQHSERRDWIRPTADGTDFVLRSEVPTERYPEVGFEVSMAAGDYLVIGSPAAAEGTLGSALFSVEAGTRPRQRVLVVRAGWRGERPEGLPIQPSPAGAPIAAQAARR